MYTEKMLREKMCEEQMQLLNEEVELFILEEALKEKEDKGVRQYLEGFNIQWRRDERKATMQYCLDKMKELGMENAYNLSTEIHKDYIVIKKYQLQAENLDLECLIEADKRNIIAIGDSDDEQKKNKEEQIQGRLQSMTTNQKIIDFLD